ncbi:hypothetical protein DCPSUM001_24920 [Dysgonomonas capnocytophagoides]|nr:hypothetical protein DCPSUM001_24920 [Dysgonomonas capnocytophagoides]
MPYSSTLYDDRSFIDLTYFIYGFSRNTLSLAPKIKKTREITGNPPKYNPREQFEYVPRNDSNGSESSSIQEYTKLGTISCIPDILCFR